MSYLIKPLGMINHKKYLLLLLLAASSTLNLAAQSPREYIGFNASWSFSKADSNASETVNLPHTWNALDVMDDVPGYYRGVGIYKKKLALKTEWKNKNLFHGLG